MIFLTRLPTAHAANYGSHALCMRATGLWSQIKRAPKAKKVRKTFEVEGPAQPQALPLDERARQIFKYFKRYNYEVVESGDTIRFAGTYAASRGQAAALIFYVFCGAVFCGAEGNICCVTAALFPPHCSIGGELLPSAEQCHES